jgi:hypothetical protein
MAMVPTAATSAQGIWDFRDLLRMYIFRKNPQATSRWRWECKNAAGLLSDALCCRLP